MTEPKKYSLFGDEGTNNRSIVRVVTDKGPVPISAGYYRLVCGSPRKLWSLSLPDREPGMLEAYEYELEEKFLKEFGFELDNASAVTSRVKPAEALEIEGYFDPDGCYWPAGAKAKVRWPLTVETESIDLPDWRFTLYQGDKLYRNTNELILSLAPP